MDEKIKSYRQAIFKLDHAERKRGETPTTTIQSKLGLLPDFENTVCSRKHSVQQKTNTVAEAASLA